MAKSRQVMAALAFVGILAVGSLSGWAPEFSDEATALPFPPDAQNLKFDAKFGDVEYTSQSPLKSLAAFYLKEMASRGWEHDEAAADIDKDSIKLMFKHGRAEVELKLSQWSKEVRVSMDCERLKFTGVDDPAKLAAAGLPVPRAVLFMQKEVSLPAGAQDVQYTEEGCMLKSSLKLAETFDHFTRLIQTKGFRESRRPIITDTRRYTEFKKGAVEFSVNVFTHEIGSRIILRYKDDSPVKPVPPLAAVASLPLKGAANLAPAPGDPPATAPTTATPIDVSSNKGSATVNYNGRTYTFANVASFQTKSRGAGTTMVVFSAKPIPVSKLQSQIYAKDDFSFGDLYEFSVPERLVLQLNEHASFTFALSNLSVGRPVEQAANEMKASGGRVQGTLKMAPIEAFQNEPLSFTATVDAVIITPTTRITGPGDPVLKSDSPILADSPIPFPEGANVISREGSKFRKTYRAVVSMPLADVAAFYRQELAAKGLIRPDTDPAGDTMRFKSDALDVSVTLQPRSGKTAIEAVTRDAALAKQQGVLPEPGKGRLVLGNGSDSAVVFTIGQTNYPLRAGQGAKDYKQAINYSLAPGTYTVVVKVAGQAPQTEKIELTEGTTWGIIALPIGGALPVQLY